MARGESYHERCIVLIESCDHPRRDSGFHEYYQIGKGENDNATKTGSDDPEELIAIGMNSLWGLFNQISDKKGWTHEYMLEKISWSNLQMYMADQVRMIKRKELVKKVSKNELKDHRKKVNNGYT